MKRKHFFLSFLLSLVFLLGVIIFSKIWLEPASAIVSSCTASVDPITIERNTTATFTFSINNTSAQNINWVKITRPNSNFVMLGIISNGGFSSVASYEDSKIFTNGTLTSGGSTQIALRIISTDQEVASEDWTITVSDNSGGASPTQCTGSLGTEISGAGPDSDPPVLSAITISNVTSTSVTLSWTTDEDATSYLNYGLTDSLGTYSENSTFSTSHSYTLTGLSANTTYYFYIGNDDASGNNSEADINTFTTAVPGETGETIVITNTVTNTSTQLITPTPTPTPVPDRAPPAVKITTDLSKPFDKSPKIIGTATDPSGVVKIEYSLDNGRNFLSVDSISQPGAKSTKFEFTPPDLDEDNYKIKIRSQDGSPQFNLGISKESWILVIDRLAPQISGLLYSFGPHVINPRTDGSITAIVGIPFKSTLSTIGGATDVEVMWPEKNESAYSKLNKNQDSSLWSGELKFEEAGSFDLKFSAIDGAGNKTQTQLNKIVVVNKGLLQDASNNKSIDSKGKITVFYQEPKTKKWVKWDAESYSQKNPVKTDKNGNYSLFLPPGRFYLNIEADGFRSQDTEFFEVNEPTFINADFSLYHQKQLFGIGPFKLYLPDFSTLSVPFKNNMPEGASVKNELIGKQVPYFVLGNSNPDLLKGKSSLITVFNSWSPQASEQFSQLNKLSENNNFNFLAIAEGDSFSKAYIFGKRGQYNVPIVADRDAILIKPFGFNILPAHLFIDRFGIITNVKTGVLSEAEIENLLNKN